MDEHRVGLKPILRRVWTPPGEAPIARVDPGYEWLYVAGFVHPESGKSSFWLLSGVNGPVFSLLLKAFAEEQGVGKRKRILLVLDQAYLARQPRDQARGGAHPDPAAALLA